MTEIEKYVTAVSERKAYRFPGGKINWAILQQVHDHDIKHLIHLVQMQDAALCAILDIVDKPLTIESADAMGRIAASVHLKAEEFAASGSSSKWGGYNGDGPEAA